MFVSYGVQIVADKLTTYLYSSGNPLQPQQPSSHFPNSIYFIFPELLSQLQHSSKVCASLVSGAPGGVGWGPLSRRGVLVLLSGPLKNYIEHQPLLIAMLIPDLLLLLPLTVNEKIPDPPLFSVHRSKARAWIMDIRLK